MLLCIKALLTKTIACHAMAHYATLCHLMPRHATVPYHASMQGPASACSVSLAASLLNVWHWRVSNDQTKHTCRIQQYAATPRSRISAPVWSGSHGPAGKQSGCLEQTPLGLSPSVECGDQRAKVLMVPLVPFERQVSLCIRCDSSLTMGTCKMG